MPESEDTTAAESFTPDPAYEHSLSTDSAGGSTEANDPGDQRSAESVDEKPVGEPEILTDAEKLTAAEKVIEQAKTDPDAFLRDRGGDIFGTRFARLAKESASNRRNAKTLKEREGVIQDAEAVLQESKADPIAFLEKHVGRKAFDEWAYRILGEKPKDTVDKAGVRDEIKGLRDEIAKDRENNVRLVEERQYGAIATQYMGGVSQELQKPEHAGLTRFYSRAEIDQNVQLLIEDLISKRQEDAGRPLSSQEVQQALLGLTPAQSICRLSEELKSRLQKTTTEPQGSTSADPAKIASESVNNQDSQTLTQDMAKDVSRTVEEDFDLLSDRERMKRIAAKYS